MNNSTHSLVIKLMVDRLKQHEYLGDCILDKAPSLLALWESGALHGVASMRFYGSSRDIADSELTSMYGWAVTKICAYKGIAQSVAKYYGVPEDSAEIFAEDMTALVLGGDMCGWRHSTTRDVFRHIHSTYRPNEYLTGKDLHEKCTDAQYVRGMLHTLNELVSFGSLRA